MAILTRPGIDVIRLDEDNLYQYTTPQQKIHIIRLDFNEPTLEKMDYVINTFHKTNRFVVDVTNIKFYNYYFKKTSLKYYVINTSRMYTGLLSFFKRNNKVLLDTTKLNVAESLFVFNSLCDVLSNVEVIILSENDYNSNINIFDKWRGNVIIQDLDYGI
jgi:hypothetical protein